MRRAQRFYLAAFVVTCALGLSALALYNGLADVYGAYPVLGLKRLQPYRNNVLTTRRAKAEMIARGDCEVLLLGSSRVQIGMPVDDPGYHSEHVDNLGLIGTNLPELETAFNFAVAHNHLKRVIFCTDFESYATVRPSPFDFEYSRFNPHLDLVDYHCRNLLGVDTTTHSRDLYRDAHSHPAIGLSQRGFVPFDAIAYTTQRSFLRRLPQRTAFAAVLIQGLSHYFHTYHYSDERVAMFRAIVRRCRDEKIDLTVLLPPVHAFECEAIHRAHLGPVFERWETDLARVIAEENPQVPLWDFGGYSGPTIEEVPRQGDRQTRMKWYEDPSHFSPALGRRVLKRILGSDSDDDTSFGVRLTPANVEAHLKELRADRETYIASHQGDIAWLKGITRAAQSTRWANWHKQLSRKGARNRINPRWTTPP